MFELFNIRESHDPFANPGLSLPDSKMNSSLGRFILDPVSRKFLKADGQWTRNEAEALNFADMHAVVRACSKYGVKRSEVLLRSGPNVEFRLPLRKIRQ